MLAVCGSTHPTTPQAVGTTGSEIFIARYKLYETHAPKYFYFSIYILSTQPVSSFVSLVTHSLCAASELDIARSVCVCCEQTILCSESVTAGYERDKRLDRLWNQRGSRSWSRVEFYAQLLCCEQLARDTRRNIYQQNYMTRAWVYALRVYIFTYDSSLVRAILWCELVVGHETRE